MCNIYIFVYIHISGVVVNLQLRDKTHHPPRAVLQRGSVQRKNVLVSFVP